MTTTTLTNYTEPYLQSFEAMEATWRKNGQAWFLPVRRTAIARFVELGFPTLRDEEWRNTNLAPPAQTSFVNPDETPLTEPAFKRLEPYTIGASAAIRIYSVNGRLSKAYSQLSDLPKGVRIKSLADAFVHDREVLESVLSGQNANEEHPFVALNTAFVFDGVFISIPRNTILEGAIELVHLSESGGTPTVCHPRTVILAGENSQVKVIEHYIGFDDDVYFTNTVTDIVAAENTVVDHYKIQRESERAYHLGTVRVHQKRSSIFSNHAVSLGAAIARNDIQTWLDGEGIEAVLNGLYLLRGEQHCDTHTRIDHAQPHCRSHELYKGILDEKSSGVFNGRILVRPNAQKTDAVQSNHSLLLADTAKINTRPQLEIFADDVKCTHGATVGELDEQAIFYLRSRGIDRDTARALMISAFATEVIDEIKCEAVRNLVQTLIEERFQSRRILEG